MEIRFLDEGPKRFGSQERLGLGTLLHQTKSAFEHPLPAEK